MFVQKPIQVNIIETQIDCFVTTRRLLGTRSSGHKILEVCVASKRCTCDAGDTQEYLKDDRHSTFKLTKFIYKNKTNFALYKTKVYGHTENK